MSSSYSQNRSSSSRSQRRPSFPRGKKQYRSSSSYSSVVSKSHVSKRHASYSNKGLKQKRRVSSSVDSHTRHRHRRSLHRSFSRRSNETKSLRRSSSVSRSIHRSIPPLASRYTNASKHRRVIESRRRRRSRRERSHRAPLRSNDRHYSRRSRDRHGYASQRSRRHSISSSSFSSSTSSSSSSISPYRHRGRHVSTVPARVSDTRRPKSNVSRRQPYRNLQRRSERYDMMPRRNVSDHMHLKASRRMYPSPEPRRYRLERAAPSDYDGDKMSNRKNNFGEINSYRHGNLSQDVSADSHTRVMNTRHVPTFKRFTNTMVPRRRALPTGIERTTTCPFLLRAFYNLNEHHPIEDLSDFLLLIANKNGKPSQQTLNLSEPNKLLPEDAGSAAEMDVERAAKLERLHGFELQLYTWKDTSLRKIVDLIKDVCQECRIRTSKISLKLLHLEDDGVYKSYDLGCLHNTRPGADDKRTLLRSKFEIGDAISIAVIRLANPRNPHFSAFHAADTVMDHDMENENRESSQHDTIDINDIKMNTEYELQVPDNSHSSDLKRTNVESLSEDDEKQENEPGKINDHTTLVIEDDDVAGVIQTEERFPS